MNNIPPLISCTLSIKSKIMKEEKAFKIWTLWTSENPQSDV